ncbi:MAG TPA: hypothetical protein VHO06_21470 [Polyangia bacterium]|nr:hypothetical protein [Polyangia bacterium]
MCFGSIVPSSFGKTNSEGEAVMALLRYGTSSSLIGTASTRPPLGMSRSCDRLTMMMPASKSTSRF